MSLLQRIEQQVDRYKMLRHPFYQDWMQGKLSKEQLRNYANEYTPFVDAFPRFVSATHSLCESQAARKLLLDNLMDEEGERFSEPHPALWRQFAEGLGAKSGCVPSVSANILASTFFNLCRSSYEEGLCALYTYESQIPEVANAKIEGLNRNYGIADEKTIEFFAVHEKADVYHSQACAKLINEISAEKYDICVAAAETACRALWDFLTETHKPARVA